MQALGTQASRCQIYCRWIALNYLVCWVLQGVSKWRELAPGDSSPTGFKVLLPFSMSIWVLMGKPVSSLSLIAFYHWMCRSVSCEVYCSTCKGRAQQICQLLDYAFYSAILREGDALHVIWQTRSYTCCNGQVSALSTKRNSSFAPLLGWSMPSSTWQTSLSQSL